MLTAINTKILLAILAALIAIGGALAYQRHETAKGAAILEQQQKQAEWQNLAEVHSVNVIERE
jgi:cell division protein FtsL